MRKFNTKLHMLFIVLSIMAILSFAVGGYLYYSALKKSLFESIHQEAVGKVRDLKNEIDSYQIWSLKSVKFLSDLKELKESLVGGDFAALAETHVILDHFRDDIKVDVCYLIDRSGNTIASSNRDTPESFVGKNYGFRPYFKKAMQGDPDVYMALGVTSKQRGIYFSHPVYGDGKEGPLGVVVIKATIETIERQFKKSFDGIILMTDPHGVVFVSNREDWLYNILWKASSETISDLTKSKQFGIGPWNWTGMKLVDENNAVDSLGNEYRIHQQALDNYPGWHLTYLHSHSAVMGKIYSQLGRPGGIFLVVLCTFFGLIVFFLFTKANTEISQRKKAEMEKELVRQQRENLILDLQKALAEVKTLKGIIPICAHCKQIRDDKGYWNQIEIYIRDHSEAEFSHGMCPKCSDKLYGDEDWYIEMKKKEESKE